MNLFVSLFHQLAPILQLQEENKMPNFIQNMWKMYFILKQDVSQRDWQKKRQLKELSSEINKIALSLELLQMKNAAKWKREHT